MALRDAAAPEPEHDDGCACDRCRSRAVLAEMAEVRARRGRDGRRVREPAENLTIDYAAWEGVNGGQGDGYDYD